MTYVVSLGGSIVAPESLPKAPSGGPDVEFLVRFKRLVEEWLARDPERKIAMVIGGGNPARLWQKACRDIAELAPTEALDWIGIAATRLNAQLVKAIFGELCGAPVVIDPAGPIEFTGKVLVASGWKPGFSTDFDAVYLADRFGSKKVFNLSNIAKVYTADPRRDPSAKPIDSISWTDFRAMVGSTWTPGANLPFDPIASALAEKKGISVVCASGRDLANLENLLEGRAFIGTLIG